jgi:hypothetical protein
MNLDIATGERQGEVKLFLKEGIVLEKESLPPR